MSNEGQLKTRILHALSYEVDAQDIAVAARNAERELVEPINEIKLILEDAKKEFLGFSHRTSGTQDFYKYIEEHAKDVAIWFVRQFGVVDNKKGK
jgi:hypothetical protein